MLNEPQPIEGALSAAGFADAAGEGPDPPRAVTSVADLERLAGTVPATVERMVHGFFDNGGTRAYVASNLDALEAVEDIALLCPLPQDIEAAIAQCERRRDRVAILSLPAGLGSVEEVLAARPPQQTGFAAVHHPWVWAGGVLTPPGGHVAGVYAGRDSAYGSPTESDVVGLDDPPLERSLSDRETALLVDGAVNPLRDLRSVALGVRLWAVRTLDPSLENRYLTQRRLLICLETSIGRGLQWAAYQPNGQDLWAAVRDAVGMFLMTQWHAGVLPGRKPEEAFFVRCDRTTMTQQDLDNGRLVCVIGVAVVRPAEFVIIRIGQWTADHRCR